MPASVKELKNKVAKLHNEVAGLKAQVRWLKDVLLKVDISEQEEKDKEELRKIEAQIE